MTDPLTRSLTGSAAHPVLTFRRRYRATPGELRAAVTDPDRLAGWFGEIKGSPSAVGDHFTAWLREEPGRPAIGRVVRCEESLIAVSWSWRGDPESEITAVIEPFSAEESVLVITHALRKRARVVRYGGGWEQMMDALGRSLGAERRGVRHDREVESAAVDRWRTISSHPMELEHRFDAPVEQVWSAFASSDGLRSWWWTHWSDVEIDADVRPGGGYRIAAPTAGITVTGRYLVVAEPQRLAFTWVWQDQEGVSVDEAVDIRFHQDGRGCRVFIRHTGPWPDEEQSEAYREGWAATLSALGGRPASAR